MFSMPKMEMVEFEVEAIMAASADTESEAQSPAETYTTERWGSPEDEF